MNTIAHNISAMNAQRQFGINSRAKTKSIEKLSSGYRINRADDDAAGLAISEKMRSQIRGLDQGTRNVQDGISLLQVADGALSEVSEMLHRIKELSVQAANGTNTDTDREYLQDEVFLLLEAIDEISEDTEFNTKRVFPNKLYTEETQESNSIFDADSFVQSINIIGTPTDINELDFSISADSAQGININGTDFPWSSIANTAGNTLDIDPPKSGEYSFRYNGVEVKFTINEGTSVEDISDVLDGTTFSFKKELGTDNYVISAFSTKTSINVWAYVNRQDYFDVFSSGLHTITLVDNRTIRIKNENTGAEIEVDASFYSTGKLVTDCFSMEFNLKNGCTVTDIRNAINGATFSTSLSTDNFMDQSSVYYGYLLEEGDTYVNSSSTANRVDFSRYIIADFPLSFLESMDYDTSQMYSDDVYVQKEDLTSGEKGINVYNPSKTRAEQFVLTNESKNLITSLNGVSMNSGDSVELVYSNGTYEIKEYFIFEDDVNNAKGALDFLGEHDSNYTLNHTTMFNIFNIDLQESKHEEVIFDSFSCSSQTPGINGDIASNHSKESEGQIWIQSGANEGQGMWLTIDHMSTSILGLADVDVSTVDGATNAIVSVRDALAKVTKNRSKIGAQQNRLEHTFARENVAIENLSASESRIRDADMAFEMTEYAKINILEQVGQSMMAQTNHSQQRVIDLLSM